MRLYALLLIGLTGSLLAPGAPLAAGPEQVLPDDQIAKKLAEELGVQVLGVTPTDAKDPPTYAVRVMNPPGNDNAALLVSTLLVDATTGAILGEAHPAPNADRPDATPLRRIPDDAGGGLDLRRRTYR